MLRLPLFVITSTCPFNWRQRDRRVTISISWKGEGEEEEEDDSTSFRLIWGEICKQENLRRISGDGRNGGDKSISLLRVGVGDSRLFAVIISEQSFHLLRPMI